ncbi:hypothetical protein BGZ83_005705 [Gryganskiella cystojenkinii]|nr:hypothetical protein BGZ83_005705 [Gryganskiella cystojenkinii]
MNSFTAALAAAVSAVALTIIAVSSPVGADRVFWALPANNTDIYAGCPVELGFRVQYSDLAMLGWVQLQVLAANNSVVVDSLDNSTRSSWDLERSKNITWSVPATLPVGDYILRAFGNGSYPCKENGRRTFCQFPLEDRETVHLHALASGQSCPQSLVPSPVVVSPSTSSELLPASSNDVDASKKEGQTDESGSAEGFSIPMHIQIDPAVLTLLQQQKNETMTRQNNSTANALPPSNSSTTSTRPPINGNNVNNTTHSILNEGESQVQDKKAHRNGSQKNINTIQVASLGSLLLGGILILMVSC